MDIIEFGFQHKMKLVIQRVKSAKVKIDQQCYGRINQGLVIFLGIAQNDNRQDAVYLIKKLLNMRIFNDRDSKMNLSVQDLNLSLMIISQFTLYADNTKGNRPSFIDAAKPKIAKPLYEFFIKEIQKYNINFTTGKFGAMMDIELINDGPVTIVIES